MPLVLLVAVITIAIILVKKTKPYRRRMLMAKYENERQVDAILSGTLWVGEEQQQVLDTFGAPSKIDERVMKTKIKRIWKYFPNRRNSYDLKITIENGYVSGWEGKGINA